MFEITFELAKIKGVIDRYAIGRLKGCANARNMLANNVASVCMGLNSEGGKKSLAEQEMLESTRRSKITNVRCEMFHISNCGFEIK